MSDATNPKHYKDLKPEPIDVIEGWGLPFKLGNTVKYIARYMHKGTPLQDLKKARWYLDREITNMEAAEAKAAKVVPRMWQGLGKK